MPTSAERTRSSNYDRWKPGIKLACMMALKRVCSDERFYDSTNNKFNSLTWHTVAEHLNKEYPNYPKRFTNINVKDRYDRVLKHHKVFLRMANQMSGFQWNPSTFSFDLDDKIIKDYEEGIRTDDILRSELGVVRFLSKPGQIDLEYYHRYIHQIHNEQEFRNDSVLNSPSFIDDAISKGILTNISARPSVFINKNNSASSSSSSSLATTATTSTNGSSNTVSTLAELNNGVPSSQSSSMSVPTTTSPLNNPITNPLSHLSHHSLPSNHLYQQPSPSQQQNLQQNMQRHQELQQPPHLQFQQQVHHQLPQQHPQHHFQQQQLQSQQLLHHQPQQHHQPPQQPDHTQYMGVTRPPTSQVFNLGLLHPINQTSSLNVGPMVPSNQVAASSHHDLDFSGLMDHQTNNMIGQLPNLIPSNINHLNHNNNNDIQPRKKIRTGLVQTGLLVENYSNSLHDQDNGDDSIHNNSTNGNNNDDRNDVVTSTTGNNTHHANRHDNDHGSNTRNNSNTGNTNDDHDHSTLHPSLSEPSNLHPLEASRSETQQHSSNIGGFPYSHQNDHLTSPSAETTEANNGTNNTNTNCNSSNTIEKSRSYSNTSGTSNGMLSTGEAVLQIHKTNEMMENLVIEEILNLRVNKLISHEDFEKIGHLFQENNILFVKSAYKRLNDSSKLLELINIYLNKLD